MSAATPQPGPAQPGPPTALPSLPTTLDDKAIRDRLMRLAKGGEFPGYQPLPESRAAEGLFVADAQGTPFDYDLIGRTTGTGDDRVLRLEMRLRRKLPAVFLVVLVLTVWPGLPVTDSLLITYFRWYERLTEGAFATWMWYLPLTVIPIPWMWRGWMRKSRATATEHAMLQTERIRGVISSAARPSPTHHEGA